MSKIYYFNSLPGSNIILGAIRWAVILCFFVIIQACDFEGFQSSSMVAKDGKSGITDVSAITKSAIVVEQITNQYNYVGDIIDFQVLVSGVELDELLFSAVGLPLGLSIDKDIGVIYGSIADQAGTDGYFDVKLTISDGRSTVESVFRWAVGKLALSQKMNQPLITVAALAGTNIDEVHWTFIGPTSIAIDWRGDSNIISYGIASGLYPSTAVGLPPSPLPFSSKGPFWETKITGLQPNTLYFYTIGFTEELTFRTPPIKGSSDFWFSEIADIGNSAEYETVTPMQLQVAKDHPEIPGDDRPNFVIVPGDLTYADQSGIRSQVDTHFNDVMPWSLFAAYMPIWGNHEHGSSDDDLRNYKGRFAFPNSQTSPGVPDGDKSGEDWYWFDYGNVRFITIPEPFSGAWKDWRFKVEPIMKQAQKDSSIDFIITYGHRPAYSTGSHPTVGKSTPAKLANKLEELRALFTKYRLNFNGHSHSYERTCPIVRSNDKVKCDSSGAGLLFITGGAGGADVGSMADREDWTDTRFKHLHHIKIHVVAQKIEAYVICGADLKDDDNSCSSGEVIDQWELVSQ